MAPPRPLDCIVAMHARQMLNYAADAARIRLGAQIFSFTSGVEAEQLMLGRELACKLDYAGGARIVVTLDASGTLSAVGATAPGGTSTCCSPRALQNLVRS